MLIWFIILFLLFYFVLYFTFLPVIYTSLKGRSLFFFDLISSINRLNQSFSFFNVFLKTLNLSAFFSSLCSLLKNIKKFVVMFNIKEVAVSIKALK